MSNCVSQTYCVIFTSPTSVQHFDTEETEDGPVRKKGKSSASQKKATKANVANILHMNGTVTPCSIAYAAVLVYPCTFPQMIFHRLTTWTPQFISSLSISRMPLNGWKNTTNSATWYFGNLSWTSSKHLQMMLQRNGLMICSCGGTGEWYKTAPNEGITNFHWPEHVRYQENLPATSLILW